MLTGLLGAGLGGVLLGILLARLLGRGGVSGASLEERDRSIRSLEADLRIAQRNLEELRGEHQTLSTQARAAVAEATTLRESAEAREQRIRQLKAELQHECGKTARLRQELAERAEDMVRTSVQLRDVQTELGVARVGSDVILEQIARLEQERNDLNALVEGLRQEMAALAEASGIRTGVDFRPPDQVAGG
jgi:chromosome segregation ATPase